MDLWQLHILCKVIELKSFSKAGKTIHLSQPTVSAHIKDLEDHFGCRLIDRLSKEAVPTKAGELLYHYACKILLLRDEAETALLEFQEKIKGDLVIGGSTIPGGYILPRIISAFKQEFPEVKIYLAVGDTEKIVKDILSGVLEIGIVGAEIEEKMILQEKLIEDKMRLVVSSDHQWAKQNQVSIHKLLKEPFIIREPGSGTRRSIALSLTRKGRRLDEFNIVSQMGSTEAVKQGIKNNAGISILSTVAVSDELKTGSLTALSINGLDLKRYFYLTRHKYRTLSPTGRTFIDFLEKKTSPEFSHTF